MDDAERQGRRDELRKRALEAALAVLGAMGVVVFSIWCLTEFARS